MSRILLVDDDVDLVEVFEEILRDAGYEVRTAHDGAEALLTLRDFRPDAIVLDLDMPGMTGSKMLSQSAEEGSGLEEIPVVLLSGQADLERVAAAAGISSYLTKPTSVEKFLAMLAATLVDRRAPRPCSPLAAHSHEQDADRQVTPAR